MSAVAGEVVQRVIVAGTGKRSVRQVTAFQIEIVVQFEVSMLAIDAGVEDSPDKVGPRRVERTLCRGAFRRDDGSMDERVDLEVRPDSVDRPPRGTVRRQGFATAPPLLFFLNDFANLTPGQRRDDV